MDDNPNAPVVHEADNVIPFELGQSFRTAHPSYSSSHDDDDLLKRANDKIAEWQANSNLPSLTQVQKLFFESICAGASAMARDKIVAAIITAFGSEFGGKRALGSTWNQIAKQYEADRAQAAREERDDAAQAALTPTEKKALRDALWPKVRDLAQAPDLMDRAVQQVQARGVVNEREVIVLIYIAGTSRVLGHPLSVLAKVPAAAANHSRRRIRWN